MLRQPARKKAPAKNPIDDGKSIPAPYKGWNAADPEASMDPAYAVEMINCIPTAADVSLRAGASEFVTGTRPVKALLAYSPITGVDKLFASTDLGIHDVSVPGPISPAMISQTNGYCRAINFRTAGESALLVVNGTEPVRHYDGTTWALVPDFTVVGGGTLLSHNVINLVAFKRRVFYLERDTLNFYTLPLDSIAGDVNPFPLGALFNKGGRLVAAATWTGDGGNGQDDRIVFITSKGQAAVYAGDDPTDPDNWKLVGCYDVGEPLGFEPFIKYGGDLLYLNKSGLFPFSQLLQSTTVATAVSDLIRPAFIQAARDYGANQGWCMEIDQPNSALLINIPITTLGYSKQFVMNLVTKAWTSFTNWNAYCFRYHRGQLYMGMTSRVAKALSGLSDFGSIIQGTTKQAWNYFGARARNKKLHLLRPVLKLLGSASVEMAVDVDFRNDAQFGPTVFSPGAGAIWAVVGDPLPALWDTAIWADNSGIRLTWLSVAAPAGYAFAVRLRFSTNTAKVAWTATDLLFESGSFI